MANGTQISLRERKHAQTKKALAEALLERLREKRLRDISVKELCEALPISEVTFYNYFSEKKDVLLYLMQLWYLEMRWHLLQWEQTKTNLEIIEAWFDFTAQKTEETPWMMSEIIIYMVQRRGCIDLKEMSAAEKIWIFPEFEGIEQIVFPADMDKEQVLIPYLQKAIEAGELPLTTNVVQAGDILDAIFHGGLISLNQRGTLQLRSLYRAMLRMFWHSLRSQVIANMTAESAL